MHHTSAEQLTAQFYEWEQRGRGWIVASVPVELEPPFHPFFFKSPRPVTIADDTKRHSAFSWVKSLLVGSEKALEESEADTKEPEIPPFAFYCKEAIKVLSLSFPKGQKVYADSSRHLVMMLSNCKYPISFEIIADGEKITLQFTCRESDVIYTIGQVKAFFPECTVKEAEDDISRVLEAYPAGVICDLGLREEFMRPLAMVNSFSPDPLIGLFGVLDHLPPTDCIVIQIMFTGAVNAWSESILRSVSDGEGKPFFINAPEMLPLAKEKVSAPLCAVTMKILALSEHTNDAQKILHTAGTAFTHIFASPCNAIVPLKSLHDFDTQVAALVHRESYRLGMLLSVDELATFVHLPSETVTSTKLVRNTRKTKALPTLAQGHSLILGLNEHNGKESIASVSASQRLKHTHIIGATGTGKSTLLLSMIAQDMKYGNGLAVLDPHGDLIESLLRYVPRERIKDVIVIDPADGEFPVAFNILSAHSEIEKDILSSDLVAAFKRLSTSWGDQMNSVLANAILAFLESTEGGTLVDLRRFLVETSFRNAYLKTVPDPHVVYYWQHEYPLLKSNSIGSILTRLDTFLRPKLIRNMVAQKKGLDFEHILDTKKILLIKLSQGLIGAENSFLLGTFFVSKIYQAAMARQAKSKEERNDFFLYIDEFQNFITPSMSHILSGARKYHLGLILAHQDMQQLQKHDSELASSVVVNAGTRICFRLGDIDAKRFAGGFSYFDSEDLENLHVGEAIARIEQPNLDFSLATIPLPELDAYEAEVTEKLAIVHSREHYGTPKEKVDQLLAHLGNTVKSIVREPEKTQQIEPASISKPFTPVELPKKEASVRKTMTQHRYLQTFIKRMAESRGYKAVIEEVTPNGNGRVDVSLERAGKRIACEISATTGDQWEAHNVEKCLGAGYDEIIVCSNDNKNLLRIREQLEVKFTREEVAKVLTLVPDEVIRYFDRQVVQESKTEKIVKGYRVMVEYERNNK